MTKLHATTARILLTGSLASLALVGVSYAADPAPPAPAVKPGSSTGKEHVVFDLDLTKGPPRKSTQAIKVEGGAWEKGKGFRLTSEKDNRLVIDAGYPIREGYLEVDVIAEKTPYCEGAACDADKARLGDGSHKRNFVGLHEEASLDQGTKSGADIFYLRTGSPSYKFFAMKASGHGFDTAECEPRIGDLKDWAADGKTVHTFRLEWKGGAAIVTDRTGRVSVCEKDRGEKRPEAKPHGKNRPLMVDELRYVFLGADKFNGLNPVGLRYLRAKLVDYHKPAVKTPIAAR
jgi:hypothetical protein